MSCPQCLVFVAVRRSVVTLVVVCWSGLECAVFALHVLRTGYAPVVGHSCRLIDSTVEE